VLLRCACLAARCDAECNQRAIKDLPSTWQRVSVLLQHASCTVEGEMAAGFIMQLKENRTHNNKLQGC